MTFIKNEYPIKLGDITKKLEYKYYEDAIAYVEILDNQQVKEELLKKLEIVLKSKLIYETNEKENIDKKYKSLF